MPTNLSDKQRAMLKARGFTHAQLDSKVTRLYYLKADGTPVGGGTLLPADEYHLQRYLERGFIPLPPGTQIINGVVIKPLEEPQRPTHQHRFGRPLGSHCRVNGCTAIRTEPYGKSKKEAE